VNGLPYAARMPETSEPSAPDARADFTPAWARRAIWYQIFPERFANGDPSNDPTPESMAGADGGAPHPSWRVHPWTSDWYALEPHERAQGGGFSANVFRRRYGGDLQGILDRLDYLQELGVTALYLNPVFDSPSLHKYDGSSYHHVDPHFGPDPEGDRALIATETPEDPSTWRWTSADRLLLSLVAEVHRRGMRIILDGVWNHMGRAGFGFRDVAANQRASRFADWFKVSAWDDEAAGTRFTYHGWMTHASLPELRQDEDGLVAGPRDYIFAATRRWMAPDGKVEDGIDGWRLDVASWVALGFWRKWRQLVKSINPDAYLTGEIIDTLSVIKPFLTGDAFDAVMNYPFAFAAHDLCFGGPEHDAPSRFARSLAEQHAAFPPCVAPVMQNLFGSHDTARAASHAVNGRRLRYSSFPTYAQESRGDHPDMAVRAPTEEERQRQRQLVLLQVTALGAPMIYYGDEAGMWGANDPCCRKPMLWPELTYADEAALPDGTRRQVPDPVAFDRACFAHYQKMIALRRALPALSDGTMQILVADDDTRVLVFARQTAAQRVVVALNVSDTDQRVAVPVPRAGELVDALGDGWARASADTLELLVPARWGAVWVGPG
jgi:cyclomaltodextrinase / maltogenic alpha-amylase / neopullulanase